MNENQDIQHLQGEHWQHGHIVCSGIKQARIEGFGGCKSAGGKKWGYHGDVSECNIGKMAMGFLMGLNTWISGGIRPKLC